MEQNVKCTKPDCNCLDIAEEKNGGPVKEYPCLAASCPTLEKNWTQPQNMSTPSVEKSEGEEAVKWNPEFLWDDYSETIGESISDAEYWSGRTVMDRENFMKALAEYSNNFHSSGDRGRKEWPEPTYEEMDLAIDKLDSGLSKQFQSSLQERGMFYRGAQWAIRRVRQMNQGQKSKS